MSTDPAKDPDLPAPDAHLLQALRHAPDQDAAPLAATRAAVLEHAIQSIAQSARQQGVGHFVAVVPGGSWWQRLHQSLARQGWGTAGLTGAMASLMVAVLVGLLWREDERRDQAQESVAAAGRTPAVAQRQASQPDTLPAAQAPADSLPAPARAKLAAPAPASIARKREPIVADKAAPAETSPAGAATAVADSGATGNAEVPLPAVSPPATPGAPTASNNASVSAPVLLPPKADAIGRMALAKDSRSERRTQDTASPAPVPASAQASLHPALEALNRDPWTCVLNSGRACNPKAAQALLHSEVLRRALASAIVQGAAGAGTEITLTWRRRDSAESPTTTLGWNSARHELQWRSNQGSFAAQLEPQDSEALARLLDAVARP